MNQEEKVKQAVGNVRLADESPSRVYFEIESVTSPDTFYSIIHDKDKGVWSCTCEGNSTYREECYHIKAAMEHYEFFNAWRKITVNKVLRRMGIGSGSDGTKEHVMAIFKIFKGQPQVHFRYGERWYRFNVRDATKEQRVRNITENIRT